MDAVESSADASSADAAAASIDRRMHICVGPDQFLPTRLRVHADDSSSEWLFGEAQMHEVLALLQQAVPQRLASLLQQRVPPRDFDGPLRGDTITASLTYQPTTTSLWLLGSSEADGRTRSAVPYTLLCDVQPLR